MQSISPAPSVNSEINFSKPDIPRKVLSSSNQSLAKSVSSMPIQKSISNLSLEKLNLSRSSSQLIDDYEDAHVRVKIVRNVHEMERNGTMLMMVEEDRTYFNAMDTSTNKRETVLIRMFGDKAHQLVSRFNFDKPEENSYINIVGQNEIDAFERRWRKHWKPQLAPNEVFLDRNCNIKITTDNHLGLNDKQSMEEMERGARTSSRFDGKSK